MKCDLGARKNQSIAEQVTDEERAMLTKAISEDDFDKAAAVAFAILRRVKASLRKGAKRNSTKRRTTTTTNGRAKRPPQRERP